MTSQHAIETRERPILFSGAMVLAILAGKKTQTRRIISHDARGADQVLWTDKARLWPGREDEPYVGWVAQVHKLNGLYLPLTCPYGQPGDRLWVRETWYPAFRRDGKKTGVGAGVVYRADDGTHRLSLGWTPNGKGGGWKPSIHMPRWASRLTLEVVSVRAERLNAISEDDCRAEGCGGWEVQAPYDGGVIDWQTAREDFAETWNRINGEGAWLRNPWVWAVEFNPLPARGAGR